MATPAAPSAPAVSYDPPQNELSYYEALFAAADLAKTGEINGRDAVTFLSRSKLQVEVLRNIWNMADQNPKTNTLDKRKFFTSVRLIQFFQNGQKAQGANLMCADPHAVLRPPFFEGLTGVTIQPFGAVSGNVDAPGPTASSAQAPVAPVASAPAPAPAPSSPSRDSMATASSQQGYISSPQQPHQQIPPAPAGVLTQDPYMMLPGDQGRYESLFPQYEKDGFVYGKEAVELFTKSGLGKDVLRDIWNLVDNPVDNRLSRLEFATAMHLIVCISKKNLPLPPSLPPSLQALKDVGTDVNANGGVSAGGQVPEQPVLSPPEQQQQPISMAQPQQMPVPPLPSLRHSLNGGISSAPVPAMQQGVSGVGGGGGGIAPIQQSLSSGSVGNFGVSKTETISDAFEGMQAGTQKLSLTDGDGSSGDASLPPPVLNNAGGSSKAELEKVQSILQKLQAENISLKAQLGQYSAEEKEVRDEISRTVNEIESLSQDLTSLRSQVVNAKSSLIEASAVLKGQMEKRDLLKALVVETSAIKEAVDASLQNIHNVRDNPKGGGPHNLPLADPQVVSHPVTNPFGDAASVLTEAFPDTSSYQHGAAQIQRMQPPSQESTAPSFYSQPEPAVAQPIQSGPSEEAMRKLDEMKRQAEIAEQEARTSDDHAKALALQFEEIREEADKANAVVSEKQSKPKKKKGFLKGGGAKKEQKKELEAAMEYAAQKSDEAHRAHYALQNAQNDATRLSQDAQQKRAAADAYEMQLADEITSVNQNHPSPAPLSREEFSTAARGQHTTPINPYGTRFGNNVEEGTPYSHPMGQTNNGSAPMGFGGYPGTPARPGVLSVAQPPDMPLMGGDPNESLMGGNNVEYGTTSKPLTGDAYAPNPPARSVFPTESQTMNQGQNGGFDLMGGAPAYPTDSSIVGGMSHAGSVSFMSTTNSVTSERDPAKDSKSKVGFPTDSSIAAVSYTSAKHSVAEISHAGLSYESIPVDAGNSSANVMTNPTDSSVTGSYVSVQELGIPKQDGTLPVVETTHVSNNSGPKTGYGTGSDLAGTQSGWSSDTQPLGVEVPSLSVPDTSTIPKENSLLTAESNDGNGSLSFSKTNSDSFEGIPSPDKEDTFQVDGEISSFGHSAGLRNKPSASISIPESKLIEPGIPTPTASNGSNYFEGLPSWGKNPAVEEFASQNHPRQQTGDADAAPAAASFEVQGETSTQPTTLPPSENGTAVTLASDNLQVGITGFGAMASTSRDNLIPSPTDEYANPFAP